MPFAWGLNDCCTFACGGVAAVTGVEPFPELRGHRTWFAASRALLRHGCRDPHDIACLALGTPLARPLLAQRGDVVGGDLGHGTTLGLCLGAACAFVGEAGLLRVPLTFDRLRAAWRV